MKNKPLAFQIWVVFTGITLLISLAVAILYPWSLRGFFNRELFETIENAQMELILGNGADPTQDREGPNRPVNHVFISLRERPQTKLPVKLIQEIRKEAEAQQAEVQRYTRKVDDERILYVIRKGEDLGRKDVFLLSYMRGAVPNRLVWTLFQRLMLITLGVIVVSWLPAHWLAKYLSRPLVTMADHVRRIAEKDWHAPLRVDRRDEIGRLAHSIEAMRQQLVRKDEAQQALLQHVSHELKTPVMVIRSYAQSVQDGIYPKGDLAGSVKVIEEEAGRLEKRIRDLLYLTKLEYLSTREPQQETVDLAALVREAADRLRWRRPELDLEIEGEGLLVRGDGEQLGVALENLLDNGMRYAASRIAVSLAEEGGRLARVRFWNDGPPIEAGVREKLFAEFQKGDKGEFGLGLAIVQRIAALHGGRVWADNEAGGAAFYLEIPALGRLA